VLKGHKKKIRLAKMKAEDIKTDLEELKRFKKKNAEERLKFIDFWAEYVRTHSDKEWSQAQNKVINGQAS
jgi:hypothetical protein